MAAGPTPRQVNDKARRILQREARLRGGVYHRATVSHFPEVTLPDGVQLSVSLLRASNGEACLMPLARRDSQWPWHRAWRFDDAIAAAKEAA